MAAKKWLPRRVAVESPASCARANRPVALRHMRSDMKPEDLVAKHLDSLEFPADACRLKIAWRAGQADHEDCQWKASRARSLQGSWGLASEAAEIKTCHALQLPGDYRGEQFVFNGNKIYIAATSCSAGLLSLPQGFVHGQDYRHQGGIAGRRTVYFAGHWKNLDQESSRSLLTQATPKS